MREYFSFFEKPKDPMSFPRCGSRSRARKIREWRTASEEAGNHN